MTTMKKAKPTTRQRTAPRTKVKRVAEAAIGETGEQRDTRHADAFRDLEQPMREVFCMAEIAADAAAMGTDKNEIEILHFAVGRLCEAVRDLRAEYMADLQRVEA
jgi:hypothetical protein